MDAGESRLVLLAQAGDREALDTLFRALANPLFRFLRSLLRSDASAEEVLQDVFVLIFRKVKWLKDPDLFRPWVFRIAAREASRRRYRDQRWQELDPQEAAALAAPEPPDDGFRKQLPEMLEQVSPASRSVLLLHYLEEMPLEDVAAVLDVPLGTVKSRLAYGLASMRRLMGRADDRTRTEGSNRWIEKPGEMH